MQAAEAKLSVMISRVPNTLIGLADGVPIRVRQSPRADLPALPRLFLSLSMVMILLRHQLVVVAKRRIGDGEAGGENGGREGRAVRGGRNRTVYRQHGEGTEVHGRQGGPRLPGLSPVAG